MSARRATGREAWMVGLALVAACSGDSTEPPPPGDDGTQVMDVSLEPATDGIAGMIVRVTGAKVDSVVGVGVVAGLISAEATTADFVIAGDGLARGLVARLFLAAPSTVAALTIAATDVVGGEALDDVDAAAQKLSLRATPATALVAAQRTAAAHSTRPPAASPTLKPANQTRAIAKAQHD